MPRHPDPESSGGRLRDGEGDATATLSLRIDLEPGGRIGPGKIALLEAIAEHGSISAAGRALGMSYRRAWDLVEETSAIFGSAVAVRQVGGRNGGGAALSSLGAELVTRFRCAEREAARAVQGHLDALQDAAGRSKAPRAPVEPEA